MSVHQTEPGSGDDIWNGRYGGSNDPLWRHKIIYASSDQGILDRIPWMSTLYSALGSSLPGARRGRPLDVLRSLSCIMLLRPQIAFFNSAGCMHIAEEMNANACETISAILFAWSRLPFLGKDRHSRAAWPYAQIASARDVVEGGHTHLLAFLTLARICLRHGQNQEARLYLEPPCMEMSAVTDPNQKSRIYRGVAEISAEIAGYSTKSLDEACKLLNEANAIPGIGKDVTAKNNTALKDLMTHF